MSTVLVVDDEPLFRDVVGDILTAAGHSVILASSVHDALKAMRLEKPGVILTDQMMPDLDGLSFVYRVRADREWSDVRVIVVSAKSTPEDIERARQAGADDYLVKPFSAGELRSMVAGPCVTPS